MKKIYPVIGAVVFFFCTMFLMNMRTEKIIREKREELIYYNTDTRNSCPFAMGEVLKETDGTIPVFGSSELGTVSKLNETAFPPLLFQNGSSDFNMALIGRGYMQCLHHAVNLGAMADDMKYKKAVLILSPQWFSKEHLDSTTYASRFSEPMYLEFIKNPLITRATKEKIADRMESLLTSDPKQLARVKKQRQVYLNHSLNPITQLEVRSYEAFLNMKQNHLLKKEVEGRAELSGNAIKADEIDFESLMEEAEETGKANCTNNNYMIYDDYYDTYVRDVEKERKNSAAESSYLDSAEYGDLRLFLDVCQETGIEPLIISIPVNGRWYDWTGFPKEDREGYYQNIRNICSEYQVELLDFSGKEYESYFLKDIMHLGWKGWVYLDEGVYQYYKQDKSE